MTELEYNYIVEKIQEDVSHKDLNSLYQLKQYLDLQISLGEKQTIFEDPTLEAKRDILTKHIVSLLPMLNASCLAGLLHCMIQNGIIKEEEKKNCTIGHLIQLTEEKVLKVPNMGPKRTERLVYYLQLNDLHLGTTLTKKENAYLFHNAKQTVKIKKRYR